MSSRPPPVSSPPAPSPRNTKLPLPPNVHDELGSAFILESTSFHVNVFVCSLPRLEVTVEGSDSDDDFKYEQVQVEETGEDEDLDEDLQTMLHSNNPAHLIFHYYSLMLII